MTDKFSKKQRSRIMSRIRSRDTKIERDFQRRCPQAIPHPKLPFNPDFSLMGMAVFLDSPFWHCQIPKGKFDKLSQWWRDKLANNLMRDLSASIFYGYNGVRLDNRLVEEMLRDEQGECDG